MRLFVRCAPAIAALLAASTSPAQTGYTVQAITSAYNNSDPSDVNDAQQVAGTSWQGIQFLPFRWQTGVASTLPLLAGYNAGRANAINASGDVAGYAANAYINPTRACVWTANSIVPLIVPPQVVRSYAFDIDSNGKVVGSYWTNLATFDVEYPALWSPLSGLTTLALPLHAYSAKACAIAANGAIAGTAIGSYTGRHICTWIGGAAIDRTPSSSDQLDATALTGTGVIVGGRINALGNDEPILVDWVGAPGVVQLLPTLAGALGKCNDVNSSGAIVGWSTNSAQQKRAVLYSAGAIYDLNTLVNGGTGWVLEQATAISEQGVICGSGQLNGFPTGFLLLPGCVATSYCSSGTTAHGCLASMSSTGTPSASASSGFVVSASQVEGQRSSCIFYGVSGAQAAPWGAGSSFQCVQPPVQRTSTQSSGGTNNLCDGAISLDFTAYVAAHPNALGAPLQVGQTIWIQAWFRDPPSPKSSSLSNALQFPMCP